MRGVRSLLWLTVFGASLSPALVLLMDALQDQLGANPIQTLHFRTGDWALRFLLITLALTPLNRLFGMTIQQRFRRMLGLFTFFYASLHMLVYLVLDQSFSWSQIAEDIPKSPYVIVGFAAYVLLIPLALTSTRNWRLRLGRRWKILHRLVYLVAILAVIHFYWLVKADLTAPSIYAAILGLLLLARLPMPESLLRPVPFKRWLGRGRTDSR